MDSGSKFEIDGIQDSDLGLQGPNFDYCNTPEIISSKNQI